MEETSILFVGGLNDKIDEESVYMAFIPFGDIKNVEIPIDHLTRTFT